MFRTARTTSILKRMNRRCVNEFKESVRLKRRALIVTSSVLLFPGFVFFCLYDPSYPIDLKNIVIH